MTRRDRIILYPFLAALAALLVYHSCAVAPDLAAVVGLH